MTTRATCYQRNKPVLAAQSYNTPANAPDPTAVNRKQLSPTNRLQS
ncbi:hypothetical protein [Alloscardovia omnicolens]|uniref:Uncharacterized protein n=1 Tax=Alloscardovia omnicolens F0580 TaxID=1321816 RepID=U1R9S3_9BIFI|nr:hypothetical protein [Alloscardovia omnicolens]ERH30309.1 hypothetical protein HMPREF9244_01071 [Alloscardovia omnicolens F0580]MBS6346067.1 hypothetical protein [Alloscardovia omnicolens]MDK6249094.1 hypothetical protein [Alloscardovia omnicolens]MDK6250661.1 hypothetical protein [Alloscardovia omnicolens]MDK6328333.1 hypothetical protein [Alloscardovia omnicolens]